MQYARSSTDRCIGLMNSMTVEEYHELIRKQHGGSKYGAVKKTCAQGHLHDSTFEAKRCDELHFYQRIGEISDLKTQVRFCIIPAAKYDMMPDESKTDYIADFVYMEKGIRVIEDTKGFKTADYKIKRKLMKQKYCQDGKTIFREVSQNG